MRKEQVLQSEVRPLPPEAWRWEPPTPFNIYVGLKPANSTQQIVLEKLQAELKDRFGCQFVNQPNQTTHLGSFTPMVMVFAEGLGCKVTPEQVWKKLPPPRGMPFMVTTVDPLPGRLDFDLARGQLVKKACNNGVIMAVNRAGELQEAFWASMQGNHMKIKGSPEEIYAEIALRAVAHYGAPMLTDRQETTSPISWESWVQTGVYDQIAQAAQDLGGAGIIEDKVNLVKYDPIQGLKIMAALNRVSGFGESMRALLTPLGILAVTKSGGGKVNINRNPQKGHLVPISHLVKDGYTIAKFPDSPINHEVNPSVETHEAGLICLAAAAAQQGIVKDFDQFLQFIEYGFSSSLNGQIKILPEGWLPKVAHIDHFHGHPDPEKIDPNKVELVYPDEKRFPHLDFPCGSLWSARQVLSAFSQSETFTQPGLPTTPLNNKIIVAVLPGHGSVAVCGPETSREELTNTIVNGIGIRGVKWV